MQLEPLMKATYLSCLLLTYIHFIRIAKDFYSKMHFLFVTSTSNSHMCLLDGKDLQQMPMSLTMLYPPTYRFHQASTCSLMQAFFYTITCLFHIVVYTIILQSGAIQVYGKWSYPYYSLILTVLWCFSPTNCEEMFNLHHASAHNIIEHIFGIIKWCYRILTVPSEFLLDVQARIPVALCALHDFIYTHKSDHNDNLSNSSSKPLDEEILINMNMECNGIAQAMWDNCQSILLQWALEESVASSDVESDNSSDAYQ